MGSFSYFRMLLYWNIKFNRIIDDDSGWCENNLENMFNKAIVCRTLSLDKKEV